MFYPHKLLSDEDDRKVIECIRYAESLTSGEIRVHFQKMKSGIVRVVAEEYFFKLKMRNTKRRNGVLIFVAPEMKEFAILGDEGINNVVPDCFWDDAALVMEKYFKEAEWARGLCEAIKMIGEKLAEFFPVEDDDTNELSDEISYA